MRLDDGHKKIIEKNINLVKKFHQDKINSGEILKEESDDFLSFLLYRFCYSVKSFDEKKGFKLSTYAYGNFNRCLNEFKQKRKKYINIVSLSKKMNNIEKEKKLDFSLIEYIIGTSKLSVKEKEILSLYYYQELSLEKIGEKYLCHKEKIRRIKDKAVKKLRKEIEKKGIRVEDFIK